MKNLLRFTLFLLATTVFIGCEKEIMPYQGKEGVYFSVRHNNSSTILESLWPYQPYSNVDFVRIGTEEIEFPVKVMITGPVKDYDRTFRLAVNADSTTAVDGQHYEPIQEEWTIPSGAVSTLVKVRLKRTPDLEENPVTLGLRLIPTRDFELSFPEWDAIPEFNSGIVIPEFDAGLHSLRINDIMIQPAVWSGSLQSGNRESGLFGVFTRKKMEFLMENLGLTYEDFASTETMPMVRQMLISSDGAAILIKRLNEKNPVLEDDGRLMWMGSVPWTSYLGVPYVPGP
ncbi:DUF4843 domain-containing protein [Sphingobacterium alkalisoli]|uniref:DUF4843 domain-containing protein n=1 Tax=Sphingobacterium alkalisoli TaxID=1874115 RepID=A0A4U0H285_9SPHI|nr:DUF4843 domain-containing protein [Sphingobacterium alkalisoli]TJY65737.1 DUF4843 domain-containing protein [Sphingobacterium alkalisoli]GGH18663.1 hypothetical protein GCM10011418_22430 [Sphingobacterium alkalisoli]